ncbi:uncharacterized protein [Palaemon carinicauda]|uniref:uncharacterized protein n=1 Tax=Palaemon carinicauda TaxID=392227 RepID=UPI0035B5EF7E
MDPEPTSIPFAENNGFFLIDCRRRAGVILVLLHAACPEILLGKEYLRNIRTQITSHTVPALNVSHQNLQWNLYLDADDVTELVAEHHDELTTDELKELHAMSEHMSDDEEGSEEVEHVLGSAHIRGVRKISRRGRLHRQIPFKEIAGLSCRFSIQ